MNSKINILKIKKILVIFSLLLFTVLNYNTAFSSSGEILDKQKTIKQLNNEVKELKEEKKEINKKLIELQNILVKSGFLKDNLNPRVKEKIKLLIDGYKIQKKQYEKILVSKSISLESTRDTKMKLIDLKKELYTNLVPYIEKDKLKSYLSFVKKDLLTLMENKELKENSIKKNVILKEKVNKIKEKILKHKEETKKTLKDVIIKKIDNKIEIFKNSDKFQKLKFEKKQKVIDYIIKKIDNKILEMDNIENKTEILDTKIEIYGILKNKFIKLKEDVEL